MTPLLEFWKCDFSFLGNEYSDDPVYPVNGQSGCYSWYQSKVRELRTFGWVIDKCELEKDTRCEVRDWVDAS